MNPTCNVRKRRDEIRARSGAAAGGFTLTELVVVLAVAGILTTMAIPSFSSLIETKRAKATSTDIYVALVRARSEAIKFNKSVSLVPKSGDWQNGWQILNPNDGSVLENHSPPQGVTISVATGPSTVVYNSYGRVTGGATSLQITSTGASAASRCVTVGTSGRPYTKASSC